jgi:hypothetical protein
MLSTYNPFQPIIDNFKNYPNKVEKEFQLNTLYYKETKEPFIKGILGHQIYKPNN